MQAALESAKVEEREADPAAAKAAEDAINRLARAAEKAAALPAEEKLLLLQELASAMADAEAGERVPELLRREGKLVEKAVAFYKETLRSSTATKVQKIEADSAAKKAQKRYLALKEQVKMEEDKKAAALQLAKENAQDLVDQRKAIKLTTDETLEIVKFVQGLATAVQTGDEEADGIAKEAALAAALEYRDQQKATMKRLKRAAQKAAEQLGEDTPEYADADAAYYKQKAIFEQVQKLLANTGSKGKAQQEEVDRARFGGELPGW